MVMTYVIRYHHALIKVKGTSMHTLSVSEARSNLYRLIDEAAASRTAVVITGKRNNAVLVSEEDWAAFGKPCFFCLCRRLLASHQYLAPFGLSGTGSRTDVENREDVDTL
jgi:hypothetical protein